MSNQPISLSDLTLFDCKFAESDQLPLSSSSDSQLNYTAIARSPRGRGDLWASVLLARDCFVTVFLAKTV